MSRYINDFSEDTILEVLIAYLYDGKSHRTIQRQILNLPAPSRGGGFIAMDILHHYNIRGDKKAILSSINIDEEIKNSNGSYQEMLKLIKCYKKIEQQTENKIKNQLTNIKMEITEITRETKLRINQRVLRKHILNIYEGKCALCDIDKPDLLVCSHIKPWAMDEKNRLNPSNAICLCTLHDKLFDRGYFSLDSNYNIIFGKKADKQIQQLLLGKKFRKPIETPPDIELLKFHFEEICK